MPLDCVPLDSLRHGVRKAVSFDALGSLLEHALLLPQCVVMIHCCLERTMLQQHSHTAGMCHDLTMLLA